MRGIIFMGLGSTQNMKTKQTPTQQVRKLSYLAGSEFVYRDSSMFFVTSWMPSCYSYILLHIYLCLLNYYNVYIYILNIAAIIFQFGSKKVTAQTEIRTTYVT